VLDADGHIPNDRIEDIAVERAVDTLVVANGAHRSSPSRVSERRFEPGAARGGRRADIDRRPSCCERKHVDVVVVQAGKQRAAGAVHDVVVVTWPQLADGDYASVFDAHVRA
jgi:hypothetical protein